MKHIVVVDDERDILTCVHEVLTKEGYQVTATISGAEALDLLTAQVPDLLILDLRMPNISGLEVLKSVRRKHPHLPVIVSSALRGYRHDIEIVSANVAAFLEKPLNLDDLVNTVRNVIGPPEATGKA